MAPRPESLGEAADGTDVICIPPTFLSGATSTLTPAQVAKYNSELVANDAATALLRQQTQNLQAPKAGCIISASNRAGPNSCQRRLDLHRLW